MHSNGEDEVNVLVNRIFTILVVIGIPLSVIGSILHRPSVIMFVVYCLTIIALAGSMGRATESLAIVAGPGMGSIKCNIWKCSELIISIY